MPLADQNVDVVSIDSFTTVVDVYRTTIRVLSNYVDNPEQIANLWRNRALAYRMVCNHTGSNDSYFKTTYDALDYALRRHEVHLDENDIETIANSFYDLDVFDDVFEGLDDVKELGYDISVVSNGDPDLLEAMIDNANIGGLIDQTISAEEIGVFKPDERFYQYAADRLDESIEDILHVATPWYDVIGAGHAGMKTAWLNRNSHPWERHDGDPDVTLNDFIDLKEILE